MRVCVVNPRTELAAMVALLDDMATFDPTPADDRRPEPASLRVVAPRRQRHTGQLVEGFPLTAIGEIHWLP